MIFIKQRTLDKEHWTKNTGQRTLDKEHRDVSHHLSAMPLSHGCDVSRECIRGHSLLSPSGSEKGADNLGLQGKRLSQDDTVSIISFGVSSRILFG